MTGDAGGLESAIAKLQKLIAKDEAKIEGLDIDDVLTKKGIPERDELEPYDIWYRIEGYHQALQIMQGELDNARRP